MRKSVITMLILFLFVAVIIGLYKLGQIMITPKPYYSSSGKQISDATIQCIKSIRNDNVKWSGTIVGIMPTELVGPTLTLRDSKENINPMLVEALLDQERFVAAHVLLTLRVPESNTTKEGEWNHLKIQLFADGKVSFEENNLYELWRYWKVKLDL